jgi:hypothetical protein
VTSWRSAHRGVLIHDHRLKEPPLTPPQEAKAKPRTLETVTNIRHCRKAFCYHLGRLHANHCERMDLLEQMFSLRIKTLRVTRSKAWRLRRRASCHL